MTSMQLREAPDYRNHAKPKKSQQQSLIQMITAHRVCDHCSINERENDHKAIALT